MILSYQKDSRASTRGSSEIPPKEISLISSSLSAKKTPKVDSSSATSQAQDSLEGMPNLLGHHAKEAEPGDRRHVL